MESSGNVPHTRDKGLILGLIRSSASNSSGGGAGMGVRVRNRTRGPIYSTPSSKYWTLPVYQSFGNRKAVTLTGEEVFQSLPPSFDQSLLPAAAI